MRICLASIHPRALSGQIDGLVGLSRELTRLGHAVTIVSAFDQERLYADRLALAHGDPGWLLPKIARVLRVLARLQGQADGADLVHLNLPTPAFSMLADLLRVRVRAPIVVGYEAHLTPVGDLLRVGALVHAPLFYLPRLAINNRLVARLTLHRAARYVVSSRLQAAELVATGVEPARIAVLPNAVDVAKLHPRRPDEARRALGLPAGPLVVYAGHYHHVKGVDVLIAAFARVAATLPDVRLLLAWSGLGQPRPVEAAIQRHGLTERVTRLGRVDVGQLLAAADVVALPYRMTMGQGAFPNLVLEALAVGVPLVTTDLPLLHEVIDDGRTALFCPPEDPGALARQILRLLTDADLARRMTAAQATAWAARFDPALLARQYERLYEDVLGEQACLLQSARHRRLVRESALRGAERRVGEPPRAGARAQPPTRRR